MEFSFDNAFNLIIKFGSIAVLFLYVIFSIIVIRQINLMVRTVETNYDAQLKILAWAHLAIAIVLLVIAMVI